ncbi:MAG: ABC transporter permease, partial [Thermoleophilia bacterium]|nr:ABC transporter permease [Thermoleophilia bacterium]
MRAFTIAWKDLRRAYRSPAGLAMMLAAPLLLAWILGAAFGSGDDFSISTVKTVVADLDGGAGAGTPAAGATITAALRDDSLAGLLEVTEASTAEAARAAVDAGEAAAAVIIPADLSEALMNSPTGDPGAAPQGDATGGTTEVAQAAASAPVQIEIYKDPALTVGPSIVTSVVQSLGRALSGARAAAAASVQIALAEGVTDMQTLTRLATDTAMAYATQAGFGAAIGVDLRAPQVAGVQVQEKPNVATQVLVGMMLFFMLFGASTPARTILDEHREGTLARLFITPTRRTVILGGKSIAVFLVVLLQAVVLVLAGWLLLGAHWGQAGPVAVLIVASALVAASLGLVTVSFAKTPAQAGAVSAAVFVFLGLISGNFTGGVTAGGAYAVV